jgi:hypothetical protein
MAPRLRSRRQRKQKLVRSVQTLQSWEVKLLQRIYRLFEKACGGADGGVLGVNGSINPFSLYTVLKEMDIGGRNFVDFGAGQGRALISAIILGAREAFGVELPQNINHEFVFIAVHKLMTNLGLHPSLPLSNAEWHPEDIDHVIFFYNFGFVILFTIYSN